MFVFALIHIAHVLTWMALRITMYNQRRNISRWSSNSMHCEGRRYI